MSDTKRSQIFDTLSTHLSGSVEGRRATARSGIADRTRHIQPSRIDLPKDELQRLFLDMAAKAAATVEHLESYAEASEAVSRFAATHDLPKSLRLAADLDMQKDLQSAGFTVNTGKAEASDQLSLTGAIAGVAETGTLILASSPDHPSSLNFLPDNHIVILHADAIVGSYEDAWDILRNRNAAWPSTVNWITGPSRTADIEQTIQMGAHGPRRLHILLVGNQS